MLGEGADERHHPRQLGLARRAPGQVRTEPVGLVGAELAVEERVEVIAAHRAASARSAW